MASSGARSTSHLPAFPVPARRQETLNPTVQHVSRGLACLYFDYRALRYSLDVEHLLQGLDGTDRQAMELRLAGHSTIEVAAVLGLDARVLRAPPESLETEAARTRDSQ